MSQHLLRDLDHLKREILTLGALVEESVDKALNSLINRRPELAREVIAGDEVIDAREVQIEEECLKILALHQPVAADLRFIVAALKVNNDLERMGDHASDLSERALALSDMPPLPRDIDFRSMGDLVRNMVRESLDSLVHLDAELAYRVCRSDQAVDLIHRQNFATVERTIRADMDSITGAVQALSVSRHLERIADLATNIAEDVIFLVEGQVVRHRVGKT